MVLKLPCSVCALVADMVMAVDAPAGGFYDPRNLCQLCRRRALAVGLRGRGGVSRAPGAHYAPEALCRADRNSADVSNRYCYFVWMVQLSW